MHRRLYRALTLLRTAATACDPPQRGVALLLGRRGACRLTAQCTCLFERRPEEFVAVAKRDARLADRQAAPGLAFDAAIDGDDRIGRAFDHDDPLQQDLAVAVHGDQIGRAITLAGDD